MHYSAGSSVRQRTCPAVPHLA